MFKKLEKYYFKVNKYFLLHLFTCAVFKKNTTVRGLHENDKILKHNIKKWKLISIFSFCVYARTDLFFLGNRRMHELFQIFGNFEIESFYLEKFH
jgi:hypothetical protein